MIYDPSQIKIMREAFKSAEQALRFKHPDGIDDLTTATLARCIIEAIDEGHTNPLVVASLALKVMNAQSAA